MLVGEVAYGRVLLASWWSQRRVGVLIVPSEGETENSRYVGMEVDGLW